MIGLLVRVSPAIRSVVITNSRGIATTRVDLGGKGNNPHMIKKYVPMKNTPIKQHIDNWKYANSIFYGPDRDHENFPDLTRTEVMLKPRPERRLYFFPASWFEALYPKMGFMGPYNLLFGGILAGMSREMWLNESGHLYHVYLCLLVWGPMFIGYNWISLYDKSFHFKEGKDGKMEFHNYPQAPVAMKHDQWDVDFGEVEDFLATIPLHLDVANSKTEQMKLIEDIYKAKKENIALQLEAEYRDRLNRVYEQVQKRLDYHVALEDTQKSYESKHMIYWIEDQVKKSITPQLEKEALTNCIATLNTMAKNQQ